MSSNVVKTVRQLRVPDAHRIGLVAPVVDHQKSEEALRKILEEAQLEAERIVAEARREAEVERQKARDRGLEEGREAVWQELQQQVAREWESARAPLNALLDTVERMTDWLELWQDDNVVRIAKVLAESILTMAVEEHPGWFADYLAKVVGSMRVEAVRLAVGERWADKLEMLVGSLSPIVTVAAALVETALPPYEVRIEGEGLTALAGMATALSQIEDEVRYGDRSWGA
ncbi:MAG: hypothetical protein M1600_11450 [Firmicutes bacterium]|nr:hypothetical protein [Bacillota bacterium]